MQAKNVEVIQDGSIKTVPLDKCNFSATNWDFSAKFLKQSVVNLQRLLVNSSL